MMILMIYFMTLQDDASFPFRCYYGVNRVRLADEIFFNIFLRNVI